MILISIEVIVLEDIYPKLGEELEECIPVDELNQKKKFCPKCGEELDARFLQIWRKRVNLRGCSKIIYPYL